MKANLQITRADSFILKPNNFVSQSCVVKAPHSHAFLVDGATVARWPVHYLKMDLYHQLF